MGIKWNGLNQQTSLRLSWSWFSWTLIWLNVNLVDPDLVDPDLMFNLFHSRTTINLFLLHKNELFSWKNEQEFFLVIR